jgi:hypothetical protein
MAMTTTPITRTQAAALSGRRLPAGHNWYLVTGLQWYPQFGDYARLPITAVSPFAVANVCA